MSTILITGGAGFIGTNLIKRLVSMESDRILVVDNESSGQLSNIIKYINNKQIEYFYLDIATEEFREFFRDKEINEIYNLASPASPTDYQKNQIQTIKTNIYGVNNLLEIVERNKCKMVQASTSEVYGNPQVSCQDEKYWGFVNSFGMRACYDEGKRCAEALIFSYIYEYKVDVRIARIFNTYGPFMRWNDGRIVSNFINQALRNEDIIIYGDGNQTRSLCYIDDTISGIVSLMKSENNIFGPINIGNNCEKTVLQIAEMIIDLTNSSSKIRFVEKLEDDPQRRKPSITRAYELLNWKPFIDNYSGLQKTIDFYRKLIH